MDGGMMAVHLVQKKGYPEFKRVSTKHLNFISFKNYIKAAIKMLLQGF
jgi:hypothetical protein